MKEISGSPATRRPASRSAQAQAEVVFPADVAAQLHAAGYVTPKGAVLTVANLAGVMGAKATAQLIPLCHPLMLTKVKVECREDRALPGLRVEAMAKLTGRTGVEMEALTAVSVTCLTIYDMAKAADREMEIGGVRLVEKSGGRSGDYKRRDP